MTPRELDKALLILTGVPEKKIWRPSWIEAEPEADWDEWDKQQWYYIPSGKPRRTHSLDEKSIPYFSSNLIEAWRLVEWMNGMKRPRPRGARLQYHD